MPSFLSKVFGRKKDDKDSSPLGHAELLGGKFEAVSPNVSPNAVHYLELQSENGADSGRTIKEEKDFGLPFFRTKSRPSSPEAKPKRLFDTLAPLSLDFDLKDKSAYNGYIFDESNPEAVFPDNVLGQRRLNPMEALVLIRICSKAIISRGLETLGIMTPHWYSASPDVQRRLISNFLRSLDLTTSAAAGPSSPYNTDFEDEVNFTRSIHDVAAVMRWGLRHVQLEGDSFGTNDGWYKAFFDAEAADDYPPKAFSEKLAPSLPASHLDLVVSTLEVFSSLAAFSEVNSTSGSRLSKIFGLWLLTAGQVEGKDNWRTFYARWERTGRMLEHIFLARIRDQSTDQGMPTRLLDLVRRYPFTHGLCPPTTDLQLLPYPQFTTAIHSALLVRVQYEVTSQERIPKTKVSPSVLLADAFSSKAEEGEFVELWTKITSAASKTGTELPLGNVFANESLRLLSLLTDKPKEEVKSPTLSVMSLLEPRLQRAASNGAASLSLVKPSTESAPLTTTATLSPLGSDWEQFSSSGFLGVDQSFPPLVSTLFDTDVEKTEPRDITLPISRKSSKRAFRKSLELPRSVVLAESSANSSPDTNSSSNARQQVIRAPQFEVIELDEAFVDFWSDALLDPIASDWPTFVVCKFKPTLVPELTYGIGDETTKKTLKWLVLEQVYNVKPRSVPTPLMTLAASAEIPSALPASPIAQTPTGRRLFNFWSVSRTPSSSSTGSQKAKKTPKTPKVGEMGELIEEDAKPRSPSSKKFKSLDLGIKRSGGKKSDEKTRPVGVARPEISVTSPTDVAASSAVVATGALAAAGAATTAVLLASEKQEDDIPKGVDLSTVPEAVAQTSEPVIISESTDDALKEEVVPVGAETALNGVEKPGVYAAVLEQDFHTVDAGASAEPLTALPVVADESQAQEPMKGEGDATIEGDISRHPQEVDQLPVVSLDVTSAESSSNQPLLPSEVDLHVQQEGEVEQEVPAIDEADKPVVSEAAMIKDEGERIEIPETGGEELGGVSNVGVVEEGALESVTEAATTTVISALPEVETHDTKINGPIEEAVKEEASPAENESEAISTLPVADEVLSVVAEEVGTETSGPTLSVAEPAPIVVDEAHPELDERGPSIEEASRLVAVVPTEVVPSVEDTSTKGISSAAEELEVDESAVDSVTVPVELSSAIVDHVNATGPSAVIEAPPILDDTATSTQPAEGLSGGTELAVPEDVLDHSVEVEGAAAAAVSPLVEADRFPATVSHVETAVEEPEHSVDAPVQEVSAQEAEPSIEIVTPQETTEKLPAESDALEQPTIDRTSIAEGSPCVEIGRIGESTAAGEASVDEGTTLVEEHSHEERAADPEVPVETVGTGLPETLEATTNEGSLLEDPPIDAARETAVEDVPSVETLVVGVEPDAEVPPPEPTLEEPSEQPIVSSEEFTTEAVAPVEEPSQELLVVIEETPTQVETEETPLVESQPPTEELHEEPVLKSKLSEELPMTEPALPVEEPEAASEDTPLEVLHLVVEPDATNEARLEDAALPEAADLDLPECEVVSTTSEVLGVGEVSIPEERSLELAEHAEEFPEPALPTSEGARLENISVADLSLIAGVTPPAEDSLGESTPVAVTEEGRVAEEAHVAVGEGIGADTAPEIKESDGPHEKVTASLPDVSEESPPIAEEVNPVVVEEPVASGEVPLEAQAVAEVSAVPDVAEVFEDAPVGEVDVAINVEDSKIAPEPPKAVDEPTLAEAGAPEEAKHLSVDEGSFTPIVDTLTQEPSPLENPEEPLPAETSTTTQATITEDTRNGESLAHHDEPVDNAEDSVEQPEGSLPSAADVEKKIPTSIPFEEEVSPLTPPVPDEEPPMIVEETCEAVRTVPDAPEDVSVPADEMRPVIADADQPAAVEEVLASVETSLGPNPDAEPFTEPPETSSAAPEQPVERGSEIPADIDQPIHSQEVEHSSVEGGIIDEPIVETAAKDHSSLEKPDEPTIPDAPITTSTTVIPDGPSEEEPGATLHALDPTITTSIPENGPMETLTQNTTPSIIDPSSVAELDLISVSLGEPSPELGDPASSKHLEQPTDDTDKLHAIPDAAAIDPNGRAILDEIDKALEEPRAVADSSEEPAVILLEEPELAGEPRNVIGHTKTGTEATDTTIVASPEDDVEVKTTDVSAASEPSKVDKALEKSKVGNDPTDVEGSQEVDLISIAEARQ